MMLALGTLAQVAVMAANLLEDPSLAVPTLKLLTRAFDKLFPQPTLITDLLEPLEGVSSSWDPEQVTPTDVAALADAVDPDLRSGTKVRAFMLELIRRAAHDWVLYRTSSRLEQREIAHDAYIWLFEEDEHHPWFHLRKEEGRELTSLIAICEILDLDIEFVREKIQKLTPRHIKTAGRPAERRCKQGDDHSYYNEHFTAVDFSVSCEEA